MPNSMKPSVSGPVAVRDVIGPAACIQRHATRSCHPPRPTASSRLDAGEGRLAELIRQRAASSCNDPRSRAGPVRGGVKVERVGDERRQLDRLERNAGKPDADQPADWQPREHVRDRADQRVVREDVAPPQQVQMCDAEHEQPRHAAQVDGRRVFAIRLGPVDDQQHRRAEQEREQPAHLAVDDDEGRGPGDQVGRARRAHRGGGHVGEFGEAERGDVRGEDAHDGDASNEVERGDSSGGGGHAERRKCTKCRRWRAAFRGGVALVGMRCFRRR